MKKLVVVHFVLWSALTVVAYTERVFGLPLVVLLILPVLIRYLNHDLSLQISGILVGIILGTVYAINYWLAIGLVVAYLFFSRADKRRSYRRRLFWAISFTIIFGIIIQPQLTWWFIAYHLMVISLMLGLMYANLFWRRKFLQISVGLNQETPR